MSAQTRRRLGAFHVLVTLGCSLAILATAVGVIRTFTMPVMPDMHPADGSPPLALHGMPLAEMPEMWVAAVGLLIVLLAMSTTTAAASSGAPSSSRRRRLMIIATATAGLAIDVSKTSTLGFVIPGMRGEYVISAGTASLLAVVGLGGTATGAIVFGRLCDRIGRRWTYLIGTLGFTATSMCGSMPSFGGNLVMCGLMGVAVGGLAPLLTTMLADELGGRSRAAVVGLSIAATAVGFLIASGSAWLLEPQFGWRVLWLIGAPTGIALFAFTGWIPHRAPVRAEIAPRGPAAGRVLSRSVLGGLAFVVGVMVFGLTTWLPTLARVGGVSVRNADLVLTVSALAMVPCALLATLAYRRYGPAAVLIALGVSSAAVLAVVVLGGSVAVLQGLSTVALVAALFAVNTMTAVLLPVSADLSPSSRRGRTTGAISLCNRIGGLCGPLLLAGLAVSATRILSAVMVMALAAAFFAILIGKRQSAARRDDAPSATGPTRAPRDADEWGAAA